MTSEELIDANKVEGGIFSFIIRLINPNRRADLGGPNNPLIRSVDHPDKLTNYVVISSIEVIVVDLADVPAPKCQV
ncbi:MAG TPA: hypothetical protein VJU84_02810 [Pyrinomonadaceae bacterium]|nr:hypothetical protein [Pyrinomonadaceae bacterium]